MFKPRLTTIALWLVIIFGTGILLGVFLPKLLGVQARPVMVNTAVMLRQVQTLSELVTVKYVMEKVVVLEVPAESSLAKFFSGENRVMLLAHGIVKAGIDLKRLAPEDLKLSGKKVVVRLPPPQILDAYLDDKQTRVLDHTTGLFREFDKDIEQTARQNAVDDIQRAARDSGIFRDAEERAKAQLTALFRQLGFEQIEFISH